MHIAPRMPSRIDDIRCSVTLKSCQKIVITSCEIRKKSHYVFKSSYLCQTKQHPIRLYILYIQFLQQEKFKDFFFFNDQLFHVGRLASELSSQVTLEVKGLALGFPQVKGGGWMNGSLRLVSVLMCLVQLSHKVVSDSL